MTKQFLKDSFGWGFLLWLTGYILGIILYAVVPAAYIGWIISPVATLITIGVLLKKINGNSLRYYIFVAIVWMVIAILFDYLFLVKTFKPADGYYKLDVYLYYILTLVLPVIIGWKKTKNFSEAKI